MTKTLDDFTGAYGADWTTGVLADHLGSALEAGMLVHTAKTTGKLFVTGPKGGAAVPVLCGEIVMIWTEDGYIDGRCGDHVTAESEIACPGHAEAINGWRNLSLYEREALVRELEMTADA